MDGYRVFVAGREFVVFATTRRAAARTVWVHYQLLVGSRERS